MKLDVSLEIAKISKHQYYYKPKGTKQGLKPSLSSLWIDSKAQELTILNTEIVSLMRLIHRDADTDYGYQKMTVALTQLAVNHHQFPVNAEFHFF